MTNFDLSGSDLLMADGTFVDLIGADMSNTDLRGVTLSRLHLAGWISPAARLE